MNGEPNSRSQLAIIFVVLVVVITFMMRSRQRNNARQQRVPPAVSTRVPPGAIPPGKVSVSPEPDASPEQVRGTLYDIADIPWFELIQRKESFKIHANTDEFERFSAQACHDHEKQVKAEGGSIQNVTRGEERYLLIEFPRK